MRPFLSALALIFAFLFAPVATLAESAPKPAPVAVDALHVHVQLIAPKDQIYPTGANQIGLYFKMEPGWHVYWKNAGDSGEPPQIKWTLPDGVTAGAMEFPAPQRLPLGPLMDFGYEGEVLFPMKLDVVPTVKQGKAVLNAHVTWLVCREVCIPGKADLGTMLEMYPGEPPAVTGSAVDAELMTRLAQRLPTKPPAEFKAVFQATKDGYRLGITTGVRERTAVFFPAEQGVLDNPAPQKATATPTGVVLELKKDASATAAPGQLAGVVELADGHAYTIAATPGVVKVGAAWTEILRSAALALLGGLLLNLMPCVFPVLFLKGLALVNSGSEERARLRAHGLVYAAGIVVSFWVLVAVLLGLRAAGATLGWGFQFQSPVFLSLMAGLLFFLGLSLAGQFEIGLSLTSAGGELAAKQGFAGSFFTGVLAVVVATPCTAPFMGAAVGYALAQPAVVTFGIFTALALGLAAPYVALTMQPAWTRLLPKPGAWMEVLRQAVSVMMFGAVIWLVWVVAQAYGAALVAAVLTGFLLLAVAGWFLGRWPAQRWATVVAALIVAGVIALCVFAPGELAAAPETGTQAGGATAQGQWEPWSAAAVSKYQAEGRPVLVDFTAGWCLSCQVNERVALERPETIKALEDAHVALLKADWTRRDPAITEALAALGRDGVPAYALYKPGASQPEMLPEVLTPGIVEDAVEKLGTKGLGTRD